MHALAPHAGRHAFNLLLSSRGVRPPPPKTQFGKAFKGLVPPDAIAPDGSVLRTPAGAPRMKFHDKMRYVWRGGVRCVRRVVCGMA